MNAQEAIAGRRSVRNFTSTPLRSDHISDMCAHLRSLPAAPFGNDPRFSLLAPTPEQPDVLRGLGGTIGSYGFIKNAQAFIVGALSPAPNALTDYGYLLEGAVIAATRLGIATCWLGGSFRAGKFGAAIKASDDEAVPAVIALGYGGSRRPIIDTLIERHHNDGNRRADPQRLFFTESFQSPLMLDSTREDHAPLVAVHAAPSSCNTQPWRIVISEGGLCHFYFARNQRYSRKDRLIRNADLQQIDMGIAMRHFEDVAREHGQLGSWGAIPTADVPAPPDGTEYVATWVPLG